MRSAREVALVCLLLLACGEESEHGEGDAATVASDVDGGADLDGGWASLAERPCPPDSTLTWENFGGAFVLDYCTGCHGRARGEGERQGAPIEVIFDDPASIRMLADRIWRMAADDNTYMPPVGGPDPETRRLLGEWLACGALTRAEL